VKPDDDFQVPGDGTDGRQSVSGDPDGPRSRADVLPSVPNALRHQAPPLGRDHSQGNVPFCLSFCSFF